MSRVALANDPAVVLADTPTGSLNSKGIVNSWKGQTGLRNTRPFRGTGKRKKQQEKNQKGTPPS
jgi:hypothetical protein